METREILNIPIGAYSCLLTSGQTRKHRKGKVNAFLVLSLSHLTQSGPSDHKVSPPTFRMCHQPSVWKALQTCLEDSKSIENDRADLQSHIYPLSIWCPDVPLLNQVLYEHKHHMVWVYNATARRHIENFWGQRNGSAIMNIDSSFKGFRFNSHHLQCGS